MSAAAAQEAHRRVSRAVGAGPPPVWACLAAGAGAALGFPFVVAALRPTPLLDGLPRELLVLLAPWAMARAVGGPWSTPLACGRAWAVGLGFFAVLLHWLYVAMARFGGLPGWLSVFFLGLLVAFCAAFFALAAALARRLMRRGWPLPWALAVAVVVTEWLRGDGAGFPWGAWGYAVARHLPLAHLAQVGGVPLISGWLTLAGAMLASPWWAPPGTHRRGPFGPPMIRVAVGLALVWVMGALLVSRPVACTPGPKVALVQGATNQDDKNHPQGHASDILRAHRALSLAAVEDGAQLVIWPESSVPGRVDTRRPWPVPLRLPVPGIFGCVAHQGTRAFYNSAVWAEPDGTLLGRHDKHHLVPFGEYVPLRGLLPVGRLVPGLIDVTPGQRDVPLGPGGRWGALICYDGVFARFSRSLVNAGATVLTNLTNDAWYGVTGGPYQHRDFYVMRAIENARWVARATNTGLSLFIDPHGRQHHPTRLGARDFSLGEVAYCEGRTLYGVLGEWVVVLAVVCVLASVLPRRRPPGQAVLLRPRARG